MVIAVEYRTPSKAVLMNRLVTLKKWSWLWALALASALGLAACQSEQTSPDKSQTTNSVQPPKAPEHPEHPK